MKRDKKTGFTIIEVSLVVAIAGLIFLMVFIALPQLQRGQRDAKRRDDIIMFLETVQKYQNNNRGALPSGYDENVAYGEDGDDNTWQGFYNKYLNDNFKDPSGSSYTLSVKSCRQDGCPENDTNLQNMDYTLHVFVAATCNGDTAVRASNPKKIAVMYRLEGSGTYCANT